MYNGYLSDSQRFCELFLCLATILITTILINNNNQVTPSLSKPHELSYRPNINFINPFYLQYYFLISLGNVSFRDYKFTQNDL